MKKQTGLQNHIVMIAGMILFIISSIILAFLTYESAKGSYYPSTEYSMYNWSVSTADSIAKNALYCVVGIAVFVFFSIFFQNNPKFSKKAGNIILPALYLIYFIAGIIFVLKSPYYPSSDQIITSGGATYIIEGNYSMFDPHGYIGAYPFQKSLIFYFEMLFRLFGSPNYTAVKIITVILNTMTLIMGSLLVRDLDGSLTASVIYTVLTTAFLPVFYLLPFVYGDLPSLFGTMLLVYSFNLYLKTGKKFQLVAACLGSVFAVATRSTAWIALIAMIIVTLIISIKEKNYVPVVSMGIIALISALSVTAIAIRYENLSGYDRHTGIPREAWIAMGMMESDGLSGVYNHYPWLVYDKNGSDTEKTSAEVHAYLDGRLLEFKSNPSMAKDFYRRKLDYQWTEPLFEVTTHTHSFTEDTVITGFFESLYYGKVHDISFKFMNRYQTFLYLICLIFAVKYLWTMIRKRSCPGVYAWFFYVHFVGGVALSLLWEAKARYTIPYIIFLIPVIALFFDKNKKAGI